MAEAGANRRWQRAAAPRQGPAQRMTAGGPTAGGIERGFIVHIPDGYLSPIVSVGLGVATMPGWAIATRRVQSALSDRTIPLLAIFSALSFTIMMFNIPVPGGTTAHGVGGTLAAIVLGPWAAAIAVSVALIIQALFFGDGGILAIFANCLNMAFILPIVGYVTYRILAGRSAPLSPRRVWSAGIAAYVGLTASAAAVGIELGVQPLLFSQDGHALYSPYGLTEAIPAMLASHMLGASIVEGLITAFGLAYLQQRHPEYLTAFGVALLRRAGARAIPAAGSSGAATHAGSSLAATHAGSSGAATHAGSSLAATHAGGASDAPGDVVGLDAAGRGSGWRTAGLLALVSSALLAVVAVATGGGDLGHAFGVNWAAVDWPSVATMLLVVAAIAAILVPLAWLALPRRIRGVGTGLVAAAIVAPLGLIAPGFAYGEGSAQDVQAAFGYVPQGLRDLSTFFSAPLAGYSIPLPFFSDANAALWQQAIGYEIAGLLGILVLGVTIFGIGRVLLRPRSTELSGTGAGAVADAHARIARHAVGRVAPRADAAKGGRSRWLEHTVAGITASIERAVFTEEHARAAGWLQAVDPRAKLAMFLALVLAASLSGSLVVEAMLYALVLGAAAASRIPFDFFVRRVWLGIPFFAGIVVLPAIFFVPGPRLFDLAIGPVHVAPSVPGLEGAVIFVVRVAVSVSLATLLVLTTPWADLLKSLQAVRVPRLFILVLAMAYRYIFLFLHLTNGMFEARRSRMVGRTTGGEQRRWISGSMGNLVNRSVKMSNDVYAAMVARGFTGSIRTFHAYRMRPADWAALGAVVPVALVAAVVGRWLP